MNSQNEGAASPSPRTRGEGRGEGLAALTSARWDLLIIGGGIVGAGVARDAAMRGLKVALVEQADFASGTSSRSSRLLHGGLRYLAQGRIGLVRQAGREKKILHRIAPHLARPLPFIFPAYRKSGWPLINLRIGVRIYDLLCGRIDNYGNSRGLGLADINAAVPGLRHDALAGGVRYFDSFTNDARLVLDTLRSAQAHGAILLNYARLENARRQTGHWTCTIRDTLADSPLDVQAKLIVNAAGPWADRFENSSLKLRLTKGTHLVIDHARLPVVQAVVLAQGNRILFIIPWGERIIIGTTDTDFTGDPASVAPAPQDSQYLLDQVNAAFPGANLRDHDIRATWAGLRPLIAGKPGHPSDISRRHIIRLSNDGWMDVAGGKLTTYRLMGEEAVDRAIRFLQIEAPKSQTALQPLVTADQAEGRSALLPPPPSQDLVERFCREEWAEHLDDVMLRRSGWSYYMPDATTLTQRVADWMAASLGWDSARRQRELTRLVAQPPSAVFRVP